MMRGSTSTAIFLALALLAACQPADAPPAEPAAPHPAAPEGPPPAATDLAAGTLGAKSDLYCAGLLYARNLVEGEVGDEAWDAVSLKLRDYGLAKLAAEGAMDEAAALRIADAQRWQAQADLSSAAPLKADADACNDWYMRQYLACGRRTECAAAQFTAAGPYGAEPAGEAGSPSPPAGPAN
jgi:hypothetical protein